MGCDSSTEAKSRSKADAQTIFDFTVNGKNKKEYDLEQHRGRAILMMNTASHCTFTQAGYTTATELHRKYKERGFTVLGFPCNQFGSQEPGDAEEVEQFACKRFEAEFPILEKIDVNGKNASPLWEYLKESQPGLLGSTNIKWNFTMFLVDRNGKCVERFGPGPSVKDVEKKLLPVLAEAEPKLPVLCMTLPLAPADDQNVSTTSISSEKYANNEQKDELL